MSTRGEGRTSRTRRDVVGGAYKLLKKSYLRPKYEDGGDGAIRGVEGREKTPAASENRANKREGRKQKRPHERSLASGTMRGSGNKRINGLRGRGVAKRELLLVPPRGREGYGHI